MKKLICLLTLLIPSVMMAQSIVINEKEGEPVELNVDGLQDIEFHDGNMIAKYSDGTSSSYPLSEISRLDFDGTTAVEMTSMMEGKISYSSSSGLLIVANCESSKLSVFNIGGTVVMEKVIESQVDTVDLSGLSKGIYLLRLDGKTIKIVR